MYLRRVGQKLILAICNNLDKIRFEKSGRRDISLEREETFLIMEAFKLLFI